MADGPRCLYYACGGGLGHGMRSLALARRLARRVAGRHVLLVNTPFALSLRAASADSPVELRCLSPAAPPPVASEWVRRQCDELDPDLFVVDTFPRGVGGELAEWLPGWNRGLRVLTHRGLPDHYVRQYRVAEFVQSCFELVLAPGAVDSLDVQVPIVRTGPWMVRARDELFQPEAAAVRLGCSPHERCVLVVGCGTLEECQAWIAVFQSLVSAWRSGDAPLRLALPLEIPTPPGIDPASIVRHVPLVELLPGVSLVLGNAGYHLVHETRWLGIPTRLEARPRLYDDQRGRLARAAATEDGTDAAVAELVRQFGWQT